MGFKSRSKTSLWAQDGAALGVFDRFCSKTGRFSYRVRSWERSDAARGRERATDPVPRHQRQYGAKRWGA